MQTSDRAPPPPVRGLQRLHRYLGARVTRVAVLAGRHPLAVGALGSLLALGAFALTLVTLAAGRQDALDHARDTSRSVISMLSNDVQHNFELADLSLQAVAAGLRDPLVMQLDPNIRHKVLFDRTSTAHEISAVSALDANGNVVEYGAGTPPKANLADRDYFYVHQQSRDLGLYFSKPFHSRLRGGASSIALSRRIDHADGSFAGVAAIAISLDYFQQVLDKLEVSPHGISMIVRADGTIVARSPQITSSTRFLMVRSAPFLRLLQGESGSFSAVSPIDGITRLYTFARIPGTPLIAVIAPAEQDVLAEWQRRSEIVGASALLVSGTFIVVIWLLAFALRDRGAMQSRLEHMAQTDSLTGLNNRRALDRVLLTEWQRMQRTGRELSVLFIDADHFKRYNDQHGHALGDLALQRIAAALARHLRRPGDTVARYGGEEFVAVLPDTDERGALNVAEAIRRDIEVCHSIDAKRRIPAVTVSIGCGTARQGRDTSLDAFMRRADAALYVAKTSGRNRVAAAGAANL
ncbi:sensor domain-containing diguanylate cyclase [Paraburkholderia phenazinium]|uniref:diguanylate cyclase n=1 Tax=Paraburkholderia phenazinium TaxID=60549 RepID=A0A1G7RKN8_9BURK|nr:sensor domain-containing diguanylate cyclase [Paraburkholderia phenazinium]SDG11234.1 diguanylate cyclase (GGDEF) domain-containing protein [Paraburkholderia phenazinium]